jgi:hypothetical protein
MQQDEEKIIREITGRLWSSPFEVYLSSEAFHRYCREHDLDDQWREVMEFSLDIPTLYGSAVIKNAFFHFLRHSLHSRPREFPALLEHLMRDFCSGKSCDLPVDELRMDLVHLGYPGPEIPLGFSSRPGQGRDKEESGHTG